MSTREVSKQEFTDYIKNYPNKLSYDYCAIAEPALVTYNDFSLGKYPDSIVASYKDYQDKTKIVYVIER